MSATTSTEKKLCVILKVVGGSHIGQKFRLEPATENGEDIFKIGRSTGRLFKEKGVSLYKDKEISTTHAKIEIRNGQVFYVDVRSTNGSQLNGDDVVPNVPLRLNEGDVILLGSTELCVHISDLTGESAEKSDQNDEDENAASV
jgi:pSer/pThr/pTyr-binding forkhead associated (FHA) protein